SSHLFSSDKNKSEFVYMEMESRLLEPTSFEFEFCSAFNEAAYAEELFVNGEIRPAYKYNEEQEQAKSARTCKLQADEEKGRFPLIALPNQVFVRYDQREIMAKLPTITRSSAQKLHENRRKCFLPYRPALLGCSSLTGAVDSCHVLSVHKRKRAG
ncbi:hypothetical protein KI387_002163, partial [Taxus chinensis]